MLNKKLLFAAGIVLTGLVLMGAYNRPYRWWNAFLTPLNVEDMNDNSPLKPFTKGAQVAPPVGAVSVEEWDVVPSKTDIMVDPTKGELITGKISTTDEATLKKGEELYNVYCLPCHGPEMTPDPKRQTVIRTGRYNPDDEPQWGMPAADINLVSTYSDEHIYAVITHGSAIMKRMEYHLDPEERWLVVNYLRSVINKHKNGQR